MIHSQFCCLVCGVLTTWKLLSSAKVAVADPLSQNICCLVGVYYTNVTKSLKDNVTGHGMCWFFCS